MSTAAEVSKRIEETEEGVLISYRQFDDLDNQAAVALALSRLCRENKIRRLQRGKYYKPKKSRFGELEPNESQIIKGLLDDGAYIAGMSAYNRLGLTTQVPNEVTIKGSKYFRKTKVGKLRVRYIRNIRKIYSAPQIVLQVLDAFEHIKSIPDADIIGSLTRLAQIVEKMGGREQMLLAKLALEYRPSVRALVGLVLDSIDDKLTAELKKSLNPLSSYRIGLHNSGIANLKKWRLN